MEAKYVWAMGYHRENVDKSESATLASGEIKEEKLRLLAVVNVNRISLGNGQAVAFGEVEVIDRYRALYELNPAMALWTKFECGLLIITKSSAVKAHILINPEGLISTMGGD